MALIEIDHRPAGARMKAEQDAVMPAKRDQSGPPARMRRDRHKVQDPVGAKAAPAKRDFDLLDLPSPIEGLVQMLERATAATAEMPAGRSNAPWTGAQDLDDTADKTIAAPAIDSDEKPIAGRGIGNEHGRPVAKRAQPIAQGAEAFDLQFARLARLVHDDPLFRRVSCYKNLDAPAPETLTLMRVLRFLGKSILVLLAIVGGAVVLAVAASVFAWRYWPAVTDPVPAAAVLIFDLADGVVEAVPGNPLARASMGPAMTLADFVQSLDAAGRDPRIMGVVMRLGIGELGMARAQDLRDAVLDFRHRDKFAMAFAESFGEGGSGSTQYYLATAFDEIWLQPSGEVGLIGARFEMPYLKGTFDLLGLEAQIDQREEYKSAASMFTADAMPEPQRQNLQRMVDSMVLQIADGLAARNKIDVVAARALIDRGPFPAAGALAEKLVDRLGYWDELVAQGEARGGKDAAYYTLASYAARLPEAPGDAPQIALIHGLGPVYLGDDDAGPFDNGSSMASSRIVRAFDEAVADPGIEAIVFRIDSPGGSYVASDTIRRAVERAESAGKRTIVSMGDVAASGGYFAALPAHAIVAQPGTVTGSIGVFGGKLVATGLWEKLGMRWDGVQAGANADIASMNRRYSPAGWAYLQGSLDRIYADFKDKVADGRGLAPQQVEEAAKGQVWTGADAKERGLVDELGGFSSALRLARSVAGVDAAAPIRLVEFPRPSDSYREFLRRMFAVAIRDSGLGAAIGWMRDAMRIAEPIARIAGMGQESLRAPGLEEEHP
jgi:protease-4